MVSNNPLPERITPESPSCTMGCDIAIATARLLKDMQNANVPIIPTNDRIKNLVKIVGRQDAEWDDDIAKDVIKIYDTIAPWKERIYEIWRRCDLTCDSMEHKKRGQNPCDHIFYNWNVLIGVYEDHAIAYRSQIEPTPSTEAIAINDVALTDFLRMKSYTPTISFDMSELYSFLIDEGVIHDVDEALFSDCICHAHVNELWANGVKSKIKLVIHHLKKHYSQDRFNTLCRNLHMTEQQMGKFFVPTRLQFEQRMKMLK